MKRIIFLLAFVVLGFASCVKEVNGPEIRPKGKNDVTFTVNIPQGVVNTRSVEAVDGENMINDLTLMFFEKTNNGLGLFKGFYKVPSAELPTDGRFIFDLNIPFDASTGLSQSEAYSVLAMSNMLHGNYFSSETDLDEFLSGLEGKQDVIVRRSMTRKLVGVGEDEKDNSKVIGKDNIPMTVRFSKEANIDALTMDLVRIVSRLDVVNTSSDYTLVSASVWNSFSMPNIWGDVIPDYANGGHIKRHYGVGTTGTNEIIGGLYAPENVNTVPVQNDTKTTCLIVGLRAKDDGNVYYYRLNMHKDASGQYLTRNNVYRATILGVSKKGAVNEKDAYNGGEFLLDVSVNPWESDENGLVITKGDMMLALPTRKAIFGPTATEKQYYVYTKGGPEGTVLQLVNLELPEGITTKLVGNNLYITVTEFTGVERKGSIELHYGELSGIIEIIQRGEFIKYLDLNYTEISPYPAGAAENMVNNTRPIEISSSGPWTATVMGGSDFSFSMSYFISELKGNDGNKISAIYSRGPNPNQKEKTNVVLITLDEDPENYRSVLVLTQKGSGEYSWTPALSKDEPNLIHFEANAVLSKEVGMGVNLFELLSKDEYDSWSIKLSGADADKFKLVSYAENGDSTILEPGAELGAGPTKYVKFRVLAVKSNYKNKYTANLDVYHNGALTRVGLSQDVFAFAIALDKPTSPAGGGTRTVSVAFSGDNTARMSVTLTTTLSSGVPEGSYVPKIELEDGTLVESLTDVPVLASFKVKVPTLGPPFAHLHKDEPKIKVEVTIGEQEPKSVIITQEKFDFPPALNVHTLHYDYGRWRDNGSLFQAWKTFMKNSSLFGPGGTVWAPSNIDGFENISTSSVGASDVRIWNVNQNSYSAGNAALASNWMGKEKHFVILSTYNSTNMFPYIFGSGSNGGYSCDNGSGNTSSNMTPNSAPSTSKETKLWKYLVGGEGPFGEVDVTNIRNLGGGDNACIGLTAWPRNFIPLIMSSSTPSRCMVGIDPNNNFIWVGDTEIFHTNAQNKYGDLNSDESKFFQNIIAYIINVTLYGDVFNEQFEIK